MVDQDMRDRADEPAVLQNRASGHALDDATGFLQKALVRDGQEQVPAVFGLRIKLVDAHTIFLDTASVHICKDHGLAGMNLRRACNRYGLMLRRAQKLAENAVRFILRDQTDAAGDVKIALELARRAARAFYDVGNAG